MLEGTHYTFGRQVIYSATDKITAGNLLEELHRALLIHQKNAAEIDTLYWYRRGRQPVLSRNKEVRPEINNRVVENHALEIVDFKTGYSFGSPVQYVRRDAAGRDGTKADEVSERISLLNEYMSDEDKAAQDKELAEWMFTAGVGYRMVLPAGGRGQDESPFEMDVLDPRSCFVVYHSGFGKHPLMGVQIVARKDKSPKYCVYTPGDYYEVEENQIISTGRHIMGGVPLVEYPANNIRIGAFEPVVGLLDALNTASSDRLNGIEQFVQSFMKFVNCDIDENSFKALKELGAIKIKAPAGMQADVDLISSELNQTEAQVAVDHFYQMVLTICGMPDRQGANRTTGDTGQAVILRDGWSAAESKAQDVETVFRRSEKLFLRLALKIARDMRGLDLKVSDIEVKFTRNKTDNLLVKTQGLQNILEAGIHPQTAIQTCGLFSDPEQVYLDSLPYLQKWMEQKEETPANNKPNPEGDSNAGMEMQ